MGTSSVRLDDGMYYKAAPDGELRFVTTVWGGRISRTVMLANGEGSFFAGGGYWTAERYYSDGRMEDFARDDDTSPAYKAPVSFAKWVRSHVKSMIPPQG